MAALKNKDGTELYIDCNKAIRFKNCHLRIKPTRRKKVMNEIFRKLFPSEEMRAYLKMYRRHRKELIKHAKETGEWDWYWLHESVIMQIRHMYEYYTEGNNIWQTDDSKQKIIKQLQRILELNDEIDSVRNDDLGLRYVLKDNGIEYIYPSDYQEKAKQREEKEQLLYEELYSLIGKYLRWWWD